MNGACAKSWFNALPPPPPKKKPKNERERGFSMGWTVISFVQATDGGGRSSQAVVDVVVVPGPNVRPPTFSKELFEVSVSEASSIGTAIVNLRAFDPENEPVTYSLVAGNEQGHFSIGSESGTLTVNGVIDREELSRYMLVSWTGANAAGAQPHPDGYSLA